MTRTPWLWKTEAFLLIFFWLTDEWGLYFGTAQFFGFFLFFLNHQQQHKIGEKFLLLSWHVWRLPFGRSSIGLVKFASCPSPVHSTPDRVIVLQLSQASPNLLESWLSVKWNSWLIKISCENNNKIMVELLRWKT